MSAVANEEYNPEIAKSVVGRYSDAYLHARSVTGFGDVIKVVGIVVGIILALPSLLFVFKEGGGGVLIAFSGIAAAGCFATLFYLLGTMIAAQGQILKATLDTAVNTSRFLTAADRAVAMSLVRRTSAVAQSTSVGTPPASGGSKVSSAATWNCRICGRSNPWSVSVCKSCGASEPA